MSKYGSPLRIDKVIAMSLVYYYFGTQCSYFRWICVIMCATATFIGNWDTSEVFRHHTCCVCDVCPENWISFYLLGIREPVSLISIFSSLFCFIIVLFGQPDVCALPLCSDISLSDPTYLHLATSKTCVSTAWPDWGTVLCCWIAKRQSRWPQSVGAGAPGGTG